MQKPFEWSQEKNRWLQKNRGVCFEDVLAAIESGSLLMLEKNPSKRYPHQNVYIVLIRGYVHVVPFVEDEEKIFLKTIIPNRKETKKFYKNKQ